MDPGGEGHEQRGDDVEQHRYGEYPLGGYVLGHHAAGQQRHEVAPEVRGQDYADLLLVPDEGPVVAGTVCFRDRACRRRRRHRRRRVAEAEVVDLLGIFC